MKKVLALALVLVSLLTCAAMAEAYDLVPVQFEDGFQISLPADWYQIELTEEQNAQGFFYAACSADGANTVHISWMALEAEMTIEDVQATLVGSYADATVIQINDVNFVGFTDAENDVCGFAALDATEPGMYTFWFTPASDAAFVDLATAIVMTIGNIA